MPRLLDKLKAMCKREEKDVEPVAKPKKIKLSKREIGKVKVIVNKHTGQEFKVSINARYPKDLYYEENNKFKKE